MKRGGEAFKTGQVIAFDKGSERPAARITFEVYESTGMILLGNANADGGGEVNGVDRRRQGAGRRMMEALEERFPAPDWWLAADRASHTAEGLRLMRSRRKPGRRWVHTSDCADRLPENCICEFAEPRAPEADSSED